jgi:ketose-bisphosphate aldolase
MPVVPLKEILDRAFAERYGVAAFNVFNDLSLEAVVAAAERLRSPVIVQTSVKTVRSVGADVLYAMFRAMAARVSVPTTLHLDHCPDREVVSTCLRTGWNSVLFDGSELSVEENLRQTAEVVEEARRHGAHVEGELEGIQGVEDGIGSDAPADVQSLATVLDFVRTTGVDCFAPAIGNAHGFYDGEPELDFERVSSIVAAEPIPIVLHGGSGMTPEQFRDLTGRGCAKVNVSTALKVAFTDANRDYLAENPAKYDPPSQLRFVRERVQEIAEAHIGHLGGEGRAW